MENNTPTPKDEELAAIELWNTTCQLVVRLNALAKERPELFQRTARQIFFWPGFVCGKRAFAMETAELFLTEKIIKRRVREPMSAGMRNPLLEGKVFKGVAKGTSAQSVQRFLCGEHRLIVVCVKIPSNNKPIYRRDFRSDEVADMGHQLIYGDFSFSDVLCRFCYRIAACDEIAFQMNGINTYVRISDLEACKSESPRRVDSFH
jgi:hypothetical protein